MASPDPVYNYFTLTKVVSGNSAIRKYQCNAKTCNSTILWLGSKTNLIKHLKQHNKFYLEYEASIKRKAPEEQELVPVAKRQAREAQLSIMHSFNNKISQNLQDSMVLAFVMNGWSIRTTECQYFNKFLQQFKDERLVSLPNRHVFRDAMLRKHDSLKQELIKRLKCSQAPVSLLLDGWTNVNKVKVTNLLLVSRGVAYYWCSINNHTSKNESLWLANSIKPEIESILDNGIPIVSYVADNESVMSATHSLLVKEYPFLIRIPCAAHTIQLAVRKILADKGFKLIMDEFLQLINLFISNKEQRLLLHNAQPPQAAYRLIRPCDTRWSYTLIAIKRLLKLKNYIDISLRIGKRPEKTSSFWGQLQDLVTILKPFSVATNVIQQDFATLNDVGDQFRMLQNHSNSLKLKHPSISEHILNCITTQWGDHIHEPATIATAILSAKSNISTLYNSTKIGEAQEFIINWGVIYLEYYQYIKLNSIEIKIALTNQFLEFSGKTDRFAPFQGRMDSTKRIVEKESNKIELVNPIKAWQSFRDVAPELTIVAVAILSICASEAPVERSFSIQDRIHSKSRNRLKDDIVEAQMFIKFNTQAFINSEHPTTFDAIEITPEDEIEPVELGFLKDESVGQLLAVQVQEEEKKEFEEEVQDLMQDENEDNENDSSNNNNNDNHHHNNIKIGSASPEEIKAFLQQYIVQHHLTKRSRFIGDNENALLNAMAQNNPPILTNIVDIKRMIKHLAPDSY
jgi:hypothetical protein